MTPPAALAAHPASTSHVAMRRSAPTREPLHTEAAHTHAQSAAPTPTAAASPTLAPTHNPSAHPAAPASNHTSTPAPRPLEHFDPDPCTTTALSAPPLDSSSSPAAAASPESITPMQRWAHELVLQIIQANIPPEALAIQFDIPFATLLTYLQLPEVQAEINAYEELLTLRTRLLGHAARPISLRKLLDVLQSPAPRPTRHDPEADQRALHRHAELIRRTATTIARESRAKRGPSASEGVSNGTAKVRDVSERTTSTDSVGRATGCLPASANSNSPEPCHAHGIASVSEGASAPYRTANVSERTSSSFLSSLKDDADSAANVSERTTAPSHTREPRVACLGEDQACASDSNKSADSSTNSRGCEHVAAPASPSFDPPSCTPGRIESPANHAPGDALRAAEGSMHAARDPSRRSRDRPAA